MINRPHVARSHARPSVPSMRRAGGLVWILVLFVAASTLQAQTNTRTVRFVYVVPSDRTAQPCYKAAIGNAAKRLQWWFHRELGGKTFTLHDPVVAVAKTRHTAEWYSTTPNGTQADFEWWFFDNVLDDASAITGGTWNDPNHIWVYYIDAEPACDQVGGAGGSGIAIVPEHDLRGLAALPWTPDCFPYPPTTPCRWIGGMGQEIGHAFGLPHPPGCDEGSCLTGSDSIMWQGFRNYPGTYLTPADKTTLDGSSFFSTITLTEIPSDCSTLLPICRGDFDLDGDTDLADFLFILGCFSGPGVRPPEACCNQPLGGRGTRRTRCFSLADIDWDDDVDLADLVAFQASLAGSVGANDFPRQRTDRR